MIFPEVTVEDWCLKYPALSVIKEKCSQCKRMVVLDVPFIEKDWAGLTAKKCPCGKCNPPMIFTPRNEKTEDLLLSLF